MDDVFSLIILIAWLPQAIGQLLSWTYWWQVKEYRLDRFKTLFFNIDGRRNLSLNFVFIKISALLVSLKLALFVFLILDSIFLFNVLNRKLRRPVFTQRAEKIFGTNLVFVILTITAPLLLKDLGLSKVLSFGEVSLLISSYLGILWTAPIVNMIKKQEIAKAKAILQEIKPVVIGVTGSYGKTTTKEFIAHLLSQKFKTAKTTGSENTEFGIARKVHKFVKKETKFFVVEMGAYKKGEVKVLSDIVNPDVGVITGIEPQHLELFGSLDSIKKTKFELIEALPKGGVAVFNLSNKYCRELAERAKKLRKNLKILGYPKTRITAADVDGISFEIKERSKVHSLFAPLRGVHFIENLSAAILVARYFGVAWSQIKTGCKTVKTPEKTMQMSKLKGGVILIDDTHNTTPVGFKAAIEYLFLFKNKKKVVVTPGIIELGREGKKVHEGLGRLMAKKVDKIILTNKEFAESMKRGLGKDAYKLEILGKPELDADTAILLEGRVPKNVL